MRKLMKNRKFMTQTVTVALLAVVATFQACGPGQLNKNQYASLDGNALDGVNGANSGSFIIGPGGAMVPVESTKTVAVSYSENILESLITIIGTGQPSQRVRDSYNRERTKIAESGKAEAVNAPMWMAITNLSGEVCWDLVLAEKALAAGSRRIFGQINFAGNPAQITDAARNDAIRRLARSAWARNETPEELALIKSGMASVPGTAAADVDRQMLFACTTILASLDSHDR